MTATNNTRQETEDLLESFLEKVEEILDQLTEYFSEVRYANWRDEPNNEHDHCD